MALLLREQARSDWCLGTPTSATALLLCGQARSDRCFSTPACAMALQYCTVSSGTYRVVSYSFIITGLGIPIVI